MKTIRCGSSNASPYLRKYLPHIPLCGLKPSAIDLGPGNLRNTKFTRSLGWLVLPVDAAGDHGSIRVNLGADRLPCDNGSVDLFLCNYVMCFMDEGQRAHLISEIQRAARPGAHIVVEMFRAKEAFAYNIKKISGQLEWEVIRMSKDRFIARRKLQ